MHSKTIFALVGWVLSIGGWYLWNLILSAIYPSNRLYNVKGGLLHRFGDNLLWWLVLIIIVMSCIVFELGINSLRSAWFPTDVCLGSFHSLLSLLNSSRSTFFRNTSMILAYENDLRKPRRPSFSKAGEAKERVPPRNWKGSVRLKICLINQGL